MNNLKEISKKIAKNFRKENNIKLPKNREEMLSKMTRKEKLDYIKENLILSSTNEKEIINFSDKQLNEYIIKYVFLDII